MLVGDSTTLQLLDGSANSSVNASDTSTVVMRGGTWQGSDGGSGTRLDQHSTLYMTGGTTSVSVDGFATAFISGSAILQTLDGTEGLVTTGNGQAFINGGVIFGGVFAADNSTVYFTGGTIKPDLDGVRVQVADHAKLIWSGGIITGPGDSPASIPGNGALAKASAAPAAQLPIYIDDYATLEIDGINITRSLIDPNNSNGQYSEYQLGGVSCPMARRSPLDSISFSTTRR